jgi:hypothetical protein
MSMAYTIYKKLKGVIPIYGVTNGQKIPAFGK